MKNKSNLIIYIIIGAIVIFNLASCKKYDEGPLISLKTKKGRLTGEWMLVGGDDYNPGLDQTFEFTKNGYFNTLYCTFLGCYPRFGKWELVNQKEKIEITWESGNIGNKTEYEILRLTNKELVLEDEYKNEMEFEKQ